MTEFCLCSRSYTWIHFFVSSASTVDLCFFFFFQAEDGIRDVAVTGVQTCALPISGPACYGRGGEQATVTDASIILGYINPDYFAAGSLKLTPELARRTIETTIDRKSVV